MSAPDPKWGRGVVLCVTGLSRHERQAAEELITAAGGRYSANLSRRCTHLLVASPSSAPPQSASNKLQSALRNQHKWGLKLVSTEWLLASAKLGTLVAERGFQAPLAGNGERMPLASMQTNKQQPGTAVPCATDTSSQTSGATSVADSCGAQHQEKAPHSASPPSLHTQLPEVKHSRLGPDALQQGQRHGHDSRAAKSPRSGAEHCGSRADGRGSVLNSSRAGGRDAASKGVTWAPLPNVAAEHFVAAAAVDDTDDDDDWGMNHLPLTQAGFIPTGDLLEQLRVGCAGGTRYSPLARNMATRATSSSPEEGPCQQAQHQQHEPQRQRDGEADPALDPGDLAMGDTDAGLGRARWRQGGYPTASLQISSTEGPTLGQLQQHIGGIAAAAGGDAQWLQAMHGRAPVQIASVVQQEGGSHAMTAAGPAGVVDDFLARLQQATPTVVAVSLPPFSAVDDTVAGPPLTMRPAEVALAPAAAAAVAAAAPSFCSSADLAQQLRVLQTQQPAALPTSAIQQHPVMALWESAVQQATPSGQPTRVELLVQQLQRQGQQPGSDGQGSATQRHHDSQRRSRESAALLQQLQQQGAALLQLQSGHRAQQHPEALDTAALLQQLQGTGLSPRYDGRGQHDPSQQQEQHGGSPMQTSPAPGTCPPAAASLLEQQQQPCVGSPMQASPAPAFTNTASLLEQLRASASDQQEQQLWPNAPKDTTTLLQRMAAASTVQQQQQQRSMDAAALLQQLQQPAEGAGMVRCPAQHALDAVAIMEQLQQQPEPGNIAVPCPTSAAFDAAALVRQLQQGQLLAGSKEAPATRPTLPTLDAGALMQQLQQQAGKGNLTTAAVAPRPLPSPLDVAALMQQLQQQPAAENPTKEVAARQGPPAIDTRTLMQQLQQQQPQLVTARTVAAAQPLPSALNAAALMQQLRQHPEPGKMGAAAAVAAAPWPLPAQLDAAALMQQLQLQPDGSPGAGPTSTNHHQNHLLLPCVGSASEAEGVSHAALSSSELAQRLRTLSQADQRFPSQQGSSLKTRTAQGSNQQGGAGTAQSQPAGTSSTAAGAASTLQELVRKLEAATSDAADRAQAQQQQQQQQQHPAATPTEDGGMDSTMEPSSKPTAASAAAINGVHPMSARPQKVSETVMAAPSQSPPSSITPSSQLLQPSSRQHQMPAPTQLMQRSQQMPCPTQLMQQSQQMPCPTQLMQQSQQMPEPSQPQPSLTLQLPAEVEQTALAASHQGSAVGSVHPPQPTCVVAAGQAAMPLAAGLGPHQQRHQPWRQSAAPGSVGGRSESGSVLCTPGEDAASQVADSGHGVFDGIVAIVDPELSEEEAARVAQALQQGGGRVAAGAARLGQGATHVVCQPEAALKWLSLGLGIVSPQWVVRSLKAGRQQRCLTMSADATRHLPQLSGGAAPQAQEMQGSSSQLQSAMPHAAATGSSASPLAQLQSKEAREQLLQQLAATASQASLAQGHGCAATTPASMLVGISWSVTDLPPAAVPDRTYLTGLEAPASTRCRQYSPWDVIPDSEDEGEPESEGEDELCLGPTQAAYMEEIEACNGNNIGTGPSAEAAPPGAAAQHAQQQREWLHETAFHGAASLTLVLPRDAQGELGHDTRHLAVPGRAASAMQLLQHIHDYYKEAITPEEQLELLRASPSAHAVAAVVKPAFLELRLVARHQLLGPRQSLEGLFRVTRDPSGNVYELRLGC